MAEQQISFATVSFNRYGKTTKRAAFLAEMNRIVPWQKLCDVVAPHYPKGEAGRPPIPLEQMLRINFLQVTVHPVYEWARRPLAAMMHTVVTGSAALRGKYSSASAAQRAQYSRRPLGSGSACDSSVDHSA